MFVYGCVSKEMLEPIFLLQIFEIYAHRLLHYVAETIKPCIITRIVLLLEIVNCIYNPLFTVELK